MGTPCSIDADCVPDGGFTTGTMICDFTLISYCVCSSRKSCVLGCRTKADCASGLGCNQMHRCENTCVAGDGTCPVNLSCDASGFCRRIFCRSDSECSAFCVNGACYDTQGTCDYVPA